MIGGSSASSPESRANKTTVSPLSAHLPRRPGPHFPRADGPGKYIIWRVIPASMVTNHEHLRRLRVWQCVVCLIVAVFAVSVETRCLAKNDHTFLSPTVLAAKSAYIENHGSAELEDETYKELRIWRRWEIVGTRVMADVAVVVSLQDPHAGSKPSRSLVHLELIDTKSEETVYSASGRTVRDIIRELAKRIEKKEQ